MRRLLFLTTLLAAGLSGAYQYYFQEQPRYSTVLEVYGQPVFDGLGMTSGTSTQVAAYGATAPDGTHEYEVKTRVWKGSHTAAQVHYLRASHADPTQGSFYKVGYSWGTVTIHRVLNGSWAQLCSASAPLPDQAVLRSRIADGYIETFLNDEYVCGAYDTAIASGRPGVGIGYIDDMNPARILEIWFGPRDGVGPQGVDRNKVRSYALPNSVELSWQPAQDDANGIGVWLYEIFRDGVYLGFTGSPNFSEAVLQPSTTYTYGLRAIDFHRRWGALTNFTVTTPPAGSIDARQIGVRPGQAYWGTAGEQIDMRSGNLNYTLPLLTAQGRNGGKVTFGLTYNSQMWRQDPSGTWKLGVDTGYGFGWRLLAGSVTPMWRDFWTVNHYVYTDSTGAEHRLDVNTSGVWTSKEYGVYVSYVASSNRLYWNDGSYWVLGCVARGDEQDAGTRYPTQMTDKDGNTVYVRYLPWNNYGAMANSSSRIAEIEDVRAAWVNGVYKTYTLSYAWDAANSARITGIQNHIGTSESYTFGLELNKPLRSPFVPSQDFGTTRHLGWVSNGAGQTTGFTYHGDTFELAYVYTPTGGHLNWTYMPFTFTGGRTYREVQNREVLHKPGGPAAPRFSIVRDPSDAGRTAHRDGKLRDDTGLWERTYSYVTDAGPYLGLYQTYQQRAAGAQYAVYAFSLVFTQDASGRPYVWRKTTSLDEAQPYQKLSWTDQALDVYGNLTGVAQYDYASNLVRSYSNTFVTGSSYLNVFRRNLLSSASVTQGGQTITLAQNSYDGTPVGFSDPTPCGTGFSRNYVTAAAPLGLVTQRTGPGMVRNFRYHAGGAVCGVNDGNGYEERYQVAGNAGAVSSAQPNQTAALESSFTYTPAMALSTATGPNAVTTSIVYDGVSRPTEVTTKFGAKVTYEYSNSPAWRKETINGRWKKTWVDGFGRETKIERGDAAATKSVKEFEYGPCACSPIGKLSRESNWYAPGQTPVWTVYEYDVAGRTKKVTLPDGSKTETVYEGNTVKVTDAAGKWKKTVTDVLGNLVQVDEPNPAGGVYYTYYAYNALDKMTTVTMPRDGVTQVRTWSYNAVTQRLDSVTMPETGTTSYLYNANGTVQRVTRGNGRYVTFEYDSLKRITKKRPDGFDPNECKVVEYVYGGDGSQFNAGRVTEIRYGATSPYCPHAPTEMFTYSKPGQVISKRLEMRNTQGTVNPSYQQHYGYDNEGRPTSMSYDSMGRPYSGSFVEWVTYGPGDEVLSMRRVNQLVQLESRSYNSLLQLTRHTVTNAAIGTLADFEYTYPGGGANNGRISKFKDHVTGEEVNYGYDSLNRLVSASTTGPEWGQSFSFDGFGNLLAENVTKGSAPYYNLSVNAATNRVNSWSYDGAGNVTGVPGATMAYDAENRVVSSVHGTLGTETYGYYADNKRMKKGSNYFFWNPDGTLQAELEYVETLQPGQYEFRTVKTYVYFAGQMVDGGLRDRLGNVRARLASGIGVASRHSYFPYGQERVATANDAFKFTTYFRDAKTGFDYADQRYYANQWGRFLTGDPYEASGGASEPGSWNRFGYVEGDPVNRYDPSGLASCRIETSPAISVRCTSALTGLTAEDSLYSVSIPPNVDMPTWISARTADLQYAVDRGTPGRFLVGFSAALRTAQDALRNNSDCAALFGRTSLPSLFNDPAALLEALTLDPATRWGRMRAVRSIVGPGGSEAAGRTNGFGILASGTAKPGTGPTGTVYTGATIDISVSRWVLHWDENSVRENARTLIHELGHFYNLVGAAPGSAFVWDDDSAGVENNENLTHICLPIIFRSGSQ